MFALEDASTSIGAGTVVKVKNTTNGLNADFAHGQAGDNYLNVQGNAYSPEIVNPLKVQKAGDGDVALGITLRDVRETDENGEKLLYYKQKLLELYGVLPGEAVPVLTKGIITVAASGVAGTPTPGDKVYLGAGANAGKFSTNNANAEVGICLGSGDRDDVGTNPDYFAGTGTTGKYYVIKLDL
jgi:hypothetical protein